MFTGIQDSPLYLVVFRLNANIYKRLHINLHVQF